MTTAALPTRMMLPGLQGCRECTLCQHRTKVVMGYGTFPNRVMIVGQSPGYDEDHHYIGIPFVGKTGQLLRDVLAQMGIELDSLFYTNVNKCHPWGDRKATLAEQHACRKWLDAEVEKCDPDIIVPMGDTAYRAFMPHEQSSITAIRGNPFRREIMGRERTIIPTLHPSAVSRNEKAHLADFKGDLARVFKILNEGPPQAIPFNTTKATWQDIMHVVNNAESYGFDLETAGPITARKRPIARKHQIVSVGVASEPGKGLVYPMPDHGEVLARVPELAASFANERQWKVISNVNYEKHVMMNYGIPINHYYDTLLEAWLLADTPKSLKDAFHREFGVEMMHIEAVIGKGAHQRSMRDASIEDEELVIEYASQDPDASLRLHNLLYPMVVDRGMQYLYEEVELPFADLIMEMERNGMGFDGSVLTEAGVELLAAHQSQLTRLYAQVGAEFNPNGWQQVCALLYGIPQPGKTKGALNTQRLAAVEHQYRIPLPRRYDRALINEGVNPGTDKVALAEHIASPVVRGILTARGLHKMKSTYIEGLPKHVEDDGRIHPSINQAATVTGRVAETDPNLQNIPARKRVDADIPLAGSFIRTAFVAPEGCWLYAPDLSQIEMRIAAHLSGDFGMIAQLSDPKGDIHSNTARSIFRSSPEAMIAVYGDHLGDCPMGCECGKARWKNARYLAKTIGFGVLYGLTAEGLLMRTPTLELSIDEARDFIDKFYETYPKLREWQEGIRSFVRRNGYYTTILGRRRYFPEITSSDRGLASEAANAAVNFPVQGGAVDYFKLASLAVRAKVHELGLHLGDRGVIPLRFINQVHDEIVLEGDKRHLEIIGTEVLPVMTNVYPLDVPVLADLDFGSNWGDLHGWEAAA